MARGRELLAQKITGPKRNEIRFKEIEEGKLSMPPGASNALCTHRYKFRCRQRESGEPVPEMGHLRAFRDAAIDGIVHQGER